ncbi:orotidine-5'-phosphate decarboxylase [Nitratiruptor sp. YY08-26]|uniref:orotidine-5'-phosphate decarboxylase n=1 Tax=unclassified Nitratiruptor TaxID=2624044 RepID=UPI001916616F|nr:MULTISPECIES: orotidine-5'-phosphate decarboxylase [unclassified Nitratiruptor]BCD61764.1 orotidine-5'-phosphate decarboxylase [Nitratiruptor sp. YY08-13]BCD65699.1 orotidine-5'-phosphate decarboxylase [Nitratiruptor sp. YY08-26]
MELCVALDLPLREQNLTLAKEIKEFPIWLKVGLRSYIRDGKEFIQELKAINPEFKIFADLKLYDIPNTMADAAEELAKIGVEMFNIHASAGKEAMQTVMQRLEQFSKRPLVLAVTVLTSFNEEQFRTIYNASIDGKATQFAKDAFEAGLDGVVCSVYESKKIKQITAHNFITLTPGIRPFGEDAGDQKRVADITMAKKNHSDIIVVGRPIYKAKNPKEVVQKILTKL